jgi:hypothetical protein
MAEPAAAQIGEPHIPPLSPVEVAFLVSLLSGPRPTADCHDAITVGGLMRLNLVAWHERPDGRLRRRDRGSTFSLTETAVQLLSYRAGREGAFNPVINGPCPA